MLSVGHEVVDGVVLAHAEDDADAQSQADGTDDQSPSPESESGVLLGKSSILLGDGLCLLLLSDLFQLRLLGVERGLCLLEIGLCLLNFGILRNCGSNLRILVLRLFLILLFRDRRLLCEVPVALRLERNL